MCRFLFLKDFTLFMPPPVENPGVRWTQILISLQPGAGNPFSEPHFHTCKPGVLQVPTPRDCV